MYGIYANIWGTDGINVTINVAYMDPMGYRYTYFWVNYNDLIIWLRPHWNDGS